MSKPQDLQAGAQPKELRDLPTAQAACDIFENAEGYIVQADLPGVTQEDVDIRFERNELTVVARREYAESGDSLATEFGGVMFRRTFRFPEPVDSEHIAADLDAGVLTLKLPKAPEFRPRKIAIN